MGHTYFTEDGRFRSELLLRKGTFGLAKKNCTFQEREVISMTTVPKKGYNFAALLLGKVQQLHTLFLIIGYVKSQNFRIYIKSFWKEEQK